MRPEALRRAQDLRVLVVDDDSVSRLWVSALVRKRGYQLLQADGGEAALALFGRETVDIVLMDAAMPGLGGFEAAARIKALAADRWVPVIFLSGLEERASRDRWIDVGDDFLHKPVDAQLLTARLNSMSRAILHEQHQRRVAAALAEEQELASHLMDRISGRDQANRLDWLDIRDAAAGAGSGDCLMVEEGADGVYLFVADAMGHGLAAAVTLLPVLSVFQAMARKGFEPHLIAREMNQKLRSVLPRERFIGAVVAHLNRDEGELRLWNGGLPAGYLVGPAGEPRAEFASTSPPLGVLDDEQFDGRSVRYRWQAGDHLLLWTDGFREAFADDTQAMACRVAAHFAEAGASGAAQSLWDAWRAQPTADDATLVLARLQPRPEAAVPPPPPPAAGVAERPDVLARLSLLPAQLRHRLGADAVLEALSRLGLAALGADPRVQLVLTELLANAIDHGLLQLDSALKTRGPDGFDAYHRLRDERLAALAAGSIEIEVRGTGRRTTYEIDVKDSGPGFDHRAEAQIGEAQTTLAGGGRGLYLVRSLCQRLEHLEGGTRTVATLAQTASETQEGQVG